MYILHAATEEPAGRNEDQKFHPPQLIPGAAKQVNREKYWPRSSTRPNCLLPFSLSFPTHLLAGPLNSSWAHTCTPCGDVPVSLLQNRHPYGASLVSIQHHDHLQAHKIKGWKKSQTQCRACIADQLPRAFSAHPSAKTRREVFGDSCID